MIRFPIPWIPNNQPGFWNSYNVGDSWGRTFPTSGGESGGVNVNPSATSRGVAEPFGAPRTPVIPLNTPEMQRSNDAQYIKFKPGQNPWVDATRRTAQQQEATPVPPEVAARAYAAGGGLQWDSLHGGWASPDPGASRGGPAYDTTDWNKRIENFYSLLQKAQQPVGTPALNEFNQRFGNQQNQNSNTSYRPLWG